MNLRKDADDRARERDRQVQAKLDDFRLPPPKQLLTKLRAYLLAQREAGHPGNRVEFEIKMKESNGRTLINLGPTVDPGHETNHYLLSSGARLSLGVTVRQEGSSTRLIAYRFDYQSAEAVIRFELRESSHEEPLIEARTHVHAGIEDLRLPTQLIDPFEVLDLLFFVIDPKLQELGPR